MAGTTPLAGTLAPIQTVGPFEGLTELGLVGYETVGLVLGLYIAYQAYRGYRRNESRPMLFIAIGFTLILGPPVLVLVAVIAVPTLPQTILQVVIQTFEILGLLSIIYALRMDV